jgi:hypothetical protein
VERDEEEERQGKDIRGRERTVIERKAGEIR